MTTPCRGCAVQHKLATSAPSLETRAFLQCQRLDKHRSIAGLWLQKIGGKTPPLNCLVLNSVDWLLISSSFDGFDDHFPWNLLLIPGCTSQSKIRRNYNLPLPHVRHSAASSSKCRMRLSGKSGRQAATMKNPKHLSSCSIPKYVFISELSRAATCQELQ